MTMTKPLAVLFLLLAGPAAWPADDAKPQAPAKTPTPLKVQVVFNRFQGEKKVSSLVYALPVSADDGRTDVRMGVLVPLKFEGKEYPGNVVFKSVGNSVACSADSLGDGRFKLKCGFEQSSVYAGEDPQGLARSSPLAPPVLRNFSSDATLYLRDGQTVEQVVASDPLTGDVLKVDVTLTVVK